MQKTRKKGYQKEEKKMLAKLKKIGSEQNEWLVETLKMQQKEREMATKEVQERELARLEANIQQQKEEMLAVFSEKKKNFDASAGSSQGVCSFASRT